MNISRRTFLAWGAYGGGLLIAAPGMLLTRAANADDHTSESDETKLTPLCEISPDNHITFYNPSPEMGQGVETSLAMLFMEELGGDMDKLSVKPLPYSLTRDAEGKITWKAVPQFAGGSTSIPRNWSLLRNAGATARQLLCQSAGKVFGVSPETLKTEQSFVKSQDGRVLSFGSLVKAASMENLQEGFEPVLKSKAEQHILGTEQHSSELEQIVTGKPLYAMDMDYPDAKVAVIERSPWFDGEVESVDSDAAKKLPGVRDVVILPRPDPDKNYFYLAAGVAVIADDFWTAKKARDLLNITWKKGPDPDASTEALFQQCHNLLKGQGQIVRNDGDYDGAVASAHRVLSRIYQIPLVNHALMEPQNCIAHVTDDNCTVIGPMQSPSGASRLIESYVGIERDKMNIRYTRLGGGFGRRLTSDHVAEAVAVSKLSGLPVKLIWTREDDLSHDYYRPMGVHEMTAGLDENGKVIAWSHRLAGTPKYYRRDNVKPEDMYKADMYIDDFPSALVPNLRYEYLMAKSIFPQGSWRAPAHTANSFVVQSFINELARTTGQDRLALRLDMLGEPQVLKYDQHGGPEFDTGRMANVLKKAAEMAEWGRKLPTGRGLGIAGHFTFGGYCAQVVEVELSANNKLKIEHAWCAIDVGRIVSLDGIRAQVEGGINDGLSAAMNQEVIISQGQVQTRNFDSYLMSVIGDSVRHIDVHIVDSDANPSGAGEMATPPFASALADAVVDAGGEYIYKHPMALQIKRSA